MDVDHGDLERQICKVHVRLYELDGEIGEHSSPPASLQAERNRLQRDFDLLRSRLAAVTVQHIHHYASEEPPEGLLGSGVNMSPPQSFLSSVFSRH